MKYIKATLGIIVLAFSLFSASGLALTLDLQPYTKCGLDSCSINVDLTKLGVSGLQVTTLKGATLENFASAIPKTMNTLKTTWASNNITITAKIEPGSSNYFTINYGGIILDPWFNSSVWSNWTLSPATGNPAYDAANNWWGYIVKMTNIPSNSSFNITFKKSSQADGVNCAIYNYASPTSVGSWIANASLVGNVCNFYSITLVNNTNYTMVVDSKTRTYGTAAYPYTSSFFNVIARQYNYGGAWTSATDNTFVIEGINISYTNSTYIPDPTMTTLYMNGNTSNITISNTTLLNMTGLVNATTTINLYVNGTLRASGTGSVTNLSTFPTIGLYNITAVTPNTTYVLPSSSTWWVNVTSTPPTPPLTPTGNTSVVYDIANLEPNLVYCDGNSTLVKEYTEAGVNRSITCPNGCDPVNRACNPAEYIQDIINIAIVLGLVAAFLWFIRWSRK